MKKMNIIMASCMVCLLCACSRGGTGQTVTVENTAEVTAEATVETTAEITAETKTEAVTVAEITETTVQSETVTEETTVAAETTTEETTVAETSYARLEYTIDPEKPMLALSFDDGPNTTSTVQVLDLLEEYQIPATFFLIGNNINASSVKSVKRAYEMGCEIGNHSKSHQFMDKMTAEEIKAEIDVVTETITNITGEAPKFFRPPNIAVSKTMYEAIDLTFICGIGCNDWVASVTAQERADTMLKNAADGVIYLLHDGYNNYTTVEALKIVIPQLLEQGYQFVTLSELFDAKGVAIDPKDTNMYSILK